MVLIVKNLPASGGDERDVDSNLGPKDPLEYKIPIPIFLPGKLHGQRSLAGYSP